MCLYIPATGIPILSIEGKSISQLDWCMPIKITFSFFVIISVIFSFPSIIILFCVFIIFGKINSSKKVLPILNQFFLDSFLRKLNFALGKTCNKFFLTIFYILVLGPMNLIMKPPKFDTIKIGNFDKLRYKVINNKNSDLNRNLIKKLFFIFKMALYYIG